MISYALQNNTIAFVFDCHEKRKIAISLVDWYRNGSMASTKPDLFKKPWPLSSTAVYFRRRGNHWVALSWDFHFVAFDITTFVNFRPVSSYTKNVI